MTPAQLGREVFALLLAGVICFWLEPAIAQAPLHNQPPIEAIRPQGPDADALLLAAQRATAAAVRRSDLQERERQREIEREKQQQEEEKKREQAVAMADAPRVLPSRGEPRSIADIPLTEVSNVKPEALDGAFSGTPMAGLGPAFVKAEQTFQVNALSLAAIAIHESAWGRSGYAHERNNLFGFAAYTDSPDSAMRFPTKTDGILTVAKWLKDAYLTSGGRYYRGGTLRAIGPIWAADPGWSTKVSGIVQTLQRRVSE